MALPKMMTPQNDFSAGQLNEDAKRSDDPLVKAGARQMKNWRILNSRKLTNRPGRTALFPTEGRVDEVLITPGIVVRLCFGAGTLKIIDSSGAYVAGNSGYAWTAATAKNIVWEIINRGVGNRDIIMCFPGQVPKVARWSGGTNWSFLDFAFSKNSHGGTLEPFYRLAPPSLTLQPSGYTGSINVTVSAAYFTPGMVGTIIRWMNCQILLTAYTSATVMVGTVIDQFPTTVSYPINTVIGSFGLGDLISSVSSGVSSYVAEVSGFTLSGGVTNSLQLTMLKAGQVFVTGNQLVGPNGTCTVQAGSTLISPGASVQWDEEAINQNRGWPNSCFFDQNRLGFCDLPAVPSGIVWSRTGVYNDFFVGANPTDPMFEIISNRARIYHVVNKSDEFLITDKGILYIPISASNPLKPGSVQFLQVSSDPASSVKPALTTQAIIFLNASLNRVIAILPKQGSLYIPWSTEETSLYHSDLFKTPIAIAATSATGGFQEQYVHVLNSDGSMAVGKFDVGKEWAGWLPWTSAGVINWISSLGQDLIVTTTYTSAGTPVTIAEKVDYTQYVDGGVAVNAVPAAMQAGTEPTIQMLLGGTAFTNMTDFAAAAAAVDGNFLKNLSQSPGLNSATAGYGNRVWRLVTGGPLKLSRVRITAPLDSPFSANGVTTFRIIGSHDGITWVTTYTSGNTAGVNGEQIDVTSGIDQTTAYEYWGVDVFGTTAKVVAVEQMELFWLAPGTIHKSPSAGTGPLWWLAGGTVDLMDGVMSKGPYTIDTNGNITPVVAGEDMTSATLMAGKGWVATLEPFIAHAQGGQDEGQRMRRRKIARTGVSVLDSTGFTFCNRRVSPYNAGDDQTQPPTLRETTHMFRPRGRSYDPRQALVKDMPGPITVLEIGYEVTA